MTADDKPSTPKPKASAERPASAGPASGGPPSIDPARGGATSSTTERRVRFACVMSLIALGLMAWSLVDSTPIAVIVAMSVGQALGTLSLLLFVVVVVRDLRRAHVLDQDPRSLRFKR